MNLIAIANVIKRRSKFIVLVTLAAAAAGLLGSFLRPKQYEAVAEFFLKNPFYADRNFVYNSDAKYIDYFAGDDDIKHLMVLTQSDAIQQYLIRQENLTAAYHIDTLDAKAYAGFKQDLAMRLSIWRTDNKSIQLSYLDKDPQRAARVTNLAVTCLEQSLQQFYTDTRTNMYESVLRKISEEGQMIDQWTDSLIHLREQYGINDIISPARNNIMLSSIKDNGRPGFSRGMELVQNIESMKDELVTVRAHNVSLAEQYATGTAAREMPLIYKVRTAVPPAAANGPGRFLIMLICAAVAFIFSCIFVLIQGFYQHKPVSYS